MHDRLSPCLIVCGLSAEARIAAGPGIITIAGGGNSTSLANRLSALDPSAIKAVISFGVAGALDPTLRPGDLVLAIAIVAGNRFETAPALRESWEAALVQAGSGYRSGAICGVDAPVLEPGAKRDLHSGTGALAVDMESHIAAAFAARHKVPFGAIRVISDAADHVLPPVAAHAMRPDGGIAIGAVIAGLIRQPGQLPALLATGRDAGRAFKALRRIRSALGPDFGTGA